MNYASNIRTIPIAILLELVKRYDPKMPNKGKMAFLDGMGLVLDHMFYGQENMRELRTVEQRMVGVVEAGLMDSDRNVRLSARFVYICSTSELLSPACWDGETDKQPKTKFTILCFSRVVIAMVSFHKNDEPFFPAVEPILSRLFLILGKNGIPAKETALITLGALGKMREDDVLLVRVASQLVVQLGDADSWIKSLAHSTVGSSFLVVRCLATVDVD